MSNAERIAEIRERCEATTPGPWDYDRSFPKNPNKHIRHEGVGWPIATMTSGFRPDKTRDADGEFIAHSREDIPYLLTLNAEKDKEIERLTAELEQKTMGLERYQEAEASGRLVVLPIKPGDMLYFPDKDNDKYIFSYECKFTGDIKLVCDYFENDKAWNALLSNIGKTVFLTRAEAEAALSAEGGVGVK